MTSQQCCHDWHFSFKGFVRECDKCHSRQILEWIEIPLGVEVKQY